MFSLSRSMSAIEIQNSVAESQSVDRSQPIQEIDGDGAKLIGGPVDVVAGCGGGEVKVELGSGGGGIEMVKRKRGRPPKSQAKLPPAKKNKEENEEEDVCFICFDGGNLVLCDRRGCPKAYHPACIKRDEAFFESTAKWNCGWHICSICEKTARHMCYTCTYSLCKRCIKQADFVCVRGDKGFCTLCMKTVMLIENSGQGKDETVKVDFDDKTSWEYLFKVYWVYLKGKLSLTLDELIQAKNPWKGGSAIASINPSTGVLDKVNDLKSITSETSVGNQEANESKRRKTNEPINIPHKETVNTEKNSDQKKGEERGQQNKLDEYAAIDVHNMNLIFLRRNLMENLLEDRENFHDKVVGSIVGIRVSGSDQKHDMHYRLVQVIGTCKSDQPYKIGNKSVDVMLQVLNLDKKEESLSIDTLSNEELFEGECRRLRQSIRRGIIKRFTVGEIQEKAVALQSAKFNDWMETEVLQLNHLRDQASEKGHKKGLKECLEKLQILKSAEERERRLCEIPEVHSDPKMSPDYESDDAEEYFNKDNEHMKPKNDKTITNCNNQTGTVTSSVNNGEVDMVWHYRDPGRNIQGPFSMAQLREWSTAGYFPADMMIWATRENESLLLNHALNPIEVVPVANLEKVSDSHGSLAQSSGQNWGAKSNEPEKEFKTPNIPSPIPKENTPDAQHVSPVVNDADATLVPPNTSHEEDKVQDTANPPSWSSASSLVVGGAQHRALDFLKNGELVDSGLPVGDHVATPTSNIDQIIHSSSPPCNDLPSWHGVGETIEFSTLAEESVSDLLAEVDAMESQNGFPSPTSRRNTFVEDLFGTIEEFSPTPDQGTRSDGFSSSGDIQLPCHSTTTTDEHLFVVSQGNNNNNNVFDLVKRSTGLEQQSFNSGAQRTMPENMGFKWPENVGSGRHVSELQLLPQNMIDINISTNEGENVTVGSDCRVFDPSQVMLGGGGAQAEEGGEFLQLAAAPMPPPPRSWTMALDTMAPAHTNTNRSANLGWEPHERGYAGNGGGGGSGGGGNFRQPLRGQRVCKLYESGRCRKGSTCKFMHP